MQESFNPYAAPTALESRPAASGWLGTPDESLRKVASGLGLVRAGLLVLVVSVLLYVAGTLLVVFGGVGRGVARGVLQWLPDLFGGTVIVGQTMNLLGSIRCLSIPPETRARGWIVVSVMAEAPSLLISLTGLRGTQTQAIVIAQQLFGVVALVAFILFVRKLAAYIGRTDLARRAIHLLIGWTVVIGIRLAGIAVAFLQPQPNRFQAGRGLEIEIAFGVTFLVLAVAVLVKYVNLLAETRSAILGRP